MTKLMKLMNGHNQISVLYGIQLHSIGSVLACLVTQSCLTLWTVALQAPLSMGFFRQEYWNGLHFSPPGNSPDSGIHPTSPVSLALQADSLPSEPSGIPLLGG